MQVVIRGLLAVALATGAVACMVNDHGLGSTETGKPGGDAAAGATGLAATSAPSPGAAGTMPMPSGAAGDTMPTAGTTGSAGTGAAGTGADPGTGAAGNPTGASGANGGAGVTGNAGTSGAAGATGNAGTSGAAGTGAAGTGSAVTGAAGTGAAGTGAAGTGAAGMGGKGGSGAAGSPTGTTGEIGCSDGSREGYIDRVKYPRIAACEGAWDDPGLASLDSRSPQCNRRAGNDGDRSDGRDCSVTDLCASGWSVCETAHAVSIAAPLGCGDAIVAYGIGPVFFLTRQRGTGLVCDANNQSGSNNLNGCGNIGSPADKSCAPFKTMLRDSDCAMNWPWVCAEGPIGTSQNEYGVVTKAGPGKGGVLCCKN